MPVPKELYRTSNLELAFTRVVRGSNKEYKQFFRHLFASYNQARGPNFADLSRRLRDGSYAPARPILIYQPKANGILRPLTLLRLEDQIVYQAITNLIADRLGADQSKYALNRRFGALYGGRHSSFFFRSWRRSYRRYNAAITSAFDAGRTWVADFDLVSCYELIDHSLLRSCLKPRVRNPGLLDFLFGCLAEWTTNSSGYHLRHGLPQGPEASAFLAECLLFRFDALTFKDVLYLRYIDDIRLMATEEVPLRRALVRLDLASKDAGLVPQAQKISIRQVKSVGEIVKTIPSALALTGVPGDVVTQKDLHAMFRRSLAKRGGAWHVVNATHFRYAVHRISPRARLLGRCGALLTARPDLAPSLAAYFRRFPNNRYAADLLLAALARNPTYDAAAAACIEAMDTCEPATKHTKYRRAIQTALGRSEERSITLRIASLAFRAKRRGAADAIRLIAKEPEPLVRSLVLARLFGQDAAAPFNQSQCLAALTAETRGEDPDVARFAASILIEHYSSEGSRWKEPRKCHASVKLLTLALGLRSRGPRRISPLQPFFERYGVLTPIPWKKALKRDLGELERRCIRLSRLELTDPSAHVLMLDTFNEGLLHAFSRANPALAPAFAAAAGRDAHPDLGNWLRNGALTTVLPVASTWFLDAHELRLRSELAHLKGRRGVNRGRVTKPVPFRDMAILMARARPAWHELLSKWLPII